MSCRPLTVLLILAAGLGACRDESRIASEVIARVTVSQGDVRSHPAIDPVWRAVSKGQGLASGDWVKTGPEGTAEIKFDQGGEWTLEASSTVIVEKPKSERALGVALQSGVVRGALPEGDAPVSIVGPAGKRVALRAKKGRARVRLTAGKQGTIEVAAIEGSLDVASEGGSVNSLGTGEVVDISEAAEVTRRAPLLSPPKVSRATTQTIKAGQTADLSWDNSPGAELYRVEWSDSPNFTTLSGSSDTNNQELGIVLEQPGRVYWRVAAISPGGRRGEWGPVQNVDIKAVRRHLIAPADQTSYRSRSAPRIDFSWRPLDGATGYRVVVSKKPKLSDPVIDEPTSATEWTTRSLRRGRYYWGVYASGPDGRVPLFERARRFDVGKRPEIKAPRRVTFP